MFNDIQNLENGEESTVLLLPHIICRKVMLRVAMEKCGFPPIYGEGVIKCAATMLKNFGVPCKYGLH